MAWDETPETVDINDVLLLHSTEMAYLIINGDREIWIPKSQVSNITFGIETLDDLHRPVKEIISMTIPEWLAIEKELV